MVASQLQKEIQPQKITERCARDPWRSRFFRGSFALELSHLESLWQSWRTHFLVKRLCENSLVARGLLFSSFLDLGFSSDEVTNENLCGSPTVDKFNVPKKYLERLDPEISFLAECIQESVCTTWSWTFVAVDRLTQMMRTHKWHWGISLSCPQFLPASAGLLSQRTKMTTSLNQFLLWKVVPWHSPWWVHLHPIFSGNKFETKQSRWNLQLWTESNLKYDMKHTSSCFLKGTFDSFLKEHERTLVEFYASGFLALRHRVTSWCCEHVDDVTRRKALVWTLPKIGARIQSGSRCSSRRSCKTQKKPSSKVVMFSDVVLFRYHVM